MSKDGLLGYLDHLLRVWACILLDKAGMSPEVIKSCLHWMGNSFQMYLCDARIIQDKHHNILQATLQEVINLITGSLVNSPSLAEMSTVIEDDTMGNYKDDMD
jgi:hypothetical protein